MDLDINEVFEQMAVAIKGCVTENWGTIENIVNDFLQSRKTRLELIVEMRLTNQIDDEFMKKRLLDEQIILESELHSITLISKAAAQQAANAAIGVLEKAILTALKAVL